MNRILSENIGRLKFLMNINEISDTNKLDLDAIKFYETVVPDSTDVMEVANSWEGGGYVWGGGSGLGIPLMWNNPKTGKEEVLKDKQDIKTFNFLFPLWGNLTGKLSAYFSANLILFSSHFSFV